MRHFVFVIVCTLLLAGCSGSDSEPETTTSGTGTTTTSTTDTGSGTGTTTTTGTPTSQPSNKAPQAIISATAEQGTIPFDVTFTLDGSDADGDALTFTFDANGDGALDEEGDTLPVEITFTYDAEGTYEAVLEVSDGKNSSRANVTIVATAGGSGTFAEFSGGWDAGAYNCLLRRTAPGGNENGVLYQTFEFPAGAAGREYEVTVASSSPAAYFTMEINDDGGTTLEDGGSSAGDSEAFWTGTIPEGGTWVFFGSCGGNSITVDMTIY